MLTPRDAPRPATRASRTYTSPMTPTLRPVRRLAAALLLLAAPAFAAPRPPQPPVEGEVIVQFRAGSATLRAHALAPRADAAEVDAALARRATALGGRRGHVLQGGAVVGARAQVVRASGIDASALAARLAADPEVEFAVVNRRAHILSAPNDPLYLAGPAIDQSVPSGGPAVGQWYLRAPDDNLKSAINVEAAWARTSGSADVVVAVLDTGVRFEHPDLGRVANGGRLLPGYDFVSDITAANDGGGRDPDPSDPGDWCTSGDSSSWHGTATTAIVGAATNNGVGMAGVAPGVLLLPVRVLGRCGGTTSDIMAAMRWAAGIPVAGVPDNTHPARVISMSLGSDCQVGQPCGCSAGFQSAVDDVIAAGAVVVVAGGNSVGGPVGEPGNCRGVVTVLAVRHAGTKVGYSDIGPEIGLAAPGGNCVNTAAGAPCLYPVLTATNTGFHGPANSSWFDSFTFEYGTSFSAPMVAGVAGLMFSQQPLLVPTQVVAALKASARRFPTTGAGLGTDGKEVPVCHAPVAGKDQDQCYCPNDGSLCGAGMLDAGAAVALVSGPVAGITVSTASPTVGGAVAITGASSLAANGSSLVAYAWELVNGGGIVIGFDSATNARTASLTPTTAGSFTVRLTVTDNLGATAVATQVVTVAAAPVATPASEAVAPARRGGGGASLAWVLGVLLAALVLKAPARRC